MVVFTQEVIGQGIGILYGALGGMVMGKSGNPNLGISGMMYMDDIVGLIGTFLYENGIADLNGLAEFLISFVCTFVCAVLRGLAYSVLIVTLRTNQNVTGLALTTFGVGFGNFFDGFPAKPAGGAGQISVAVIGAVYKAPVPGLSKLSVTGQTFFSCGFLTYLVVVLALALASFLARTRRELNLRAVGESPTTVGATDISITTYKHLTTYLGGGINDLGGLYFIMEYSGGAWTSSGFGDRGWLVIALIIFALQKPADAIWGFILFGGLYTLYPYISGLGRRVQEIFKVLPCVVIIMVLVITSLGGKREYQSPQSLKLPYFREEQ